MVAARLAREYLAQIAALGTTLADRVLLSGLMLRVWGVDDFVFWTVALSVAGMVTIADCGFAQYFGNRMAIAVEQGKQDEARHFLAAGNLLLCISSLVGVFAVALGWLASHPEALDENATYMPLIIILILTVAVAFRQTIAVQLAVYRAHREFARQTWAVVMGEATRFLMIAIALWLGAGPLIGAVCYASATMLFSVALPLIDIARRYPGFALTAEAPAAGERFTAFVSSSQYWVQVSIGTLFTLAPVFALSAAGAATFAIAQFALMRTLANLARTGLQLFTNVFGLEVARRVAIADLGGASATYSEATRFVAVQTAGTAGALWAVAAPLFTLWTGDARLYNPVMFWLAIGPPIVIPSLSMALLLLTTANWPRPLAAGRLLQLVLTFAFYALLPVDDIALRMMAALAAGEVLGLGLTLAIAVARRIEGAGLAFHLDLALRSVAAGLLAWGGGAGGVALGGPSPLILGCMGGGFGMLVATLTLALTPARRAMLRDVARARLTLTTPRA